MDQYASQRVVADAYFDPAPVLIRAVVVYVPQAAAVIEGVVSEGGHALRDGHGGQFAAIDEGVVADTGERPPEGHGGEIAAVTEGPIPQAAQPVQGHAAREAAAVEESVVRDALHASGEAQARQAPAAGERVRSDAFQLAGETDAAGQAPAAVKGSLADAAHGALHVQGRQACAFGKGRSVDGELAAGEVHLRNGRFGEGAVAQGGQLIQGDLPRQGGTPRKGPVADAPHAAQEGEVLQGGAAVESGQADGAQVPPDGHALQAGTGGKGPVADDGHPGGDHGFGQAGAGGEGVVGNGGHAAVEVGLGQRREPRISDEGVVVDGVGHSADDMVELEADVVLIVHVVPEGGDLAAEAELSVFVSAVGHPGSVEDHPPFPVIGEIVVVIQGSSLDAGDPQALEQILAGIAVTGADGIPLFQDRVRVGIRVALGLVGVIIVIVAHAARHPKSDGLDPLRVRGAVRRDLLRLQSDGAAHLFRVIQAVLLLLAVTAQKEILVVPQEHLRAHLRRDREEIFQDLVGDPLPLRQGRFGPAAPRQAAVGGPGGRPRGHALGLRRQVYGHFRQGRLRPIGFRRLRGNHAGGQDRQQQEQRQEQRRRLLSVFSHRSLLPRRFFCHCIGCRRGLQALRAPALPRRKAKRGCRQE